MKKFNMIIIISLISVSTNANVTLNSFFSDNVVLHRQTEVPVWDNAAYINYLGGSNIADGDVIQVATGDYLRTTQISIS